jgi:hypothetical protein
MRDGELTRAGTGGFGRGWVNEVRSHFLVVLFATNLSILSFIGVYILPFPRTSTLAPSQHLVTYDEREEGTFSRKSFTSTVSLIPCCHASPLYRIIS